MDKHIAELNPKQKTAAMHVDGPLFVVAGAGTGKTKTLTTRVAYLVKTIGIPPENILAVTFTNKAAREMKERIIQMAGPYASNVWIYTFHAFAVQILRKEIEALDLGYTKHFHIADEEDAKTIIKESIQRLNLDSKKYKVNNLRNKISYFKCFNEDRFDDDNELLVYQTYQSDLIEQNLLDFDDLQIYLYQLLREKADIRAYYQDKFQYILVDEFQDTDHIQYQMMKLLAGKHKNLFVVGDPDQSIYGFRGANYENANHFLKDFGQEHILDKNYRSTPEILTFANRLITHNRNRPVKKALVTMNNHGIEPLVWSAQSDYGEAAMIANEIKRLTSDLGYKFHDIAILYRNNALSRIFEDTLMKQNIPYVMYGGISFYQRREIKDILAYIRLLIDPHLDFYFKRVINVPKKSIGKTTVLKLEALSKQRGVSMFQAIDMLDVGGKTKEGLKHFKTLILEMQARLQTMENLDEIVMYVAYHTGYLLMLEEEKDDIALERIDNIKELKSVFIQGEQFYEGTTLEKLIQLLDQIALYTDLDRNTDDDAVILSTFHQVKGLEFKIVFMTVMEEGIFPSPLATYDSNELEEERRVAYVGVTRAKERLYLSRADSRLIYGNYTKPHASRFLKEMQPLKEIFTQQHTNNRPSEHLLKTGDKVVHNTFGEGIVIRIEDDIAAIAFKVPHGIKKILENHPSLKKIER